MRHWSSSSILIHENCITKQFQFLRWYFVTHRKRPTFRTRLPHTSLISVSLRRCECTFSGLSYGNESVSTSLSFNRLRNIKSDNWHTTLDDDVVPKIATQWTYELPTSLRMPLQPNTRRNFFKRTAKPSQSVYWNENVEIVDYKWPARLISRFAS